jgi:hypothetical protein
MPGKMSFYAAEPVDRLLADAGEDGKSQRLNRVADRYAEVVRRDVPELRAGEWMYLVDMLNSTWLEPAAVIHVIGDDVEEAEELDGLGAKWGVDPRSLAARVRGMTAGERTAMAEVVERWWGYAHGRVITDWRESLVEVGARVRGDTPG